MNSFGNHICDKKYIISLLFKYLVLEPNSTRIIARQILLLQKYEFTIKGQLGKKHGNVDALL
jgi:hypothetical protein